MSAPATDSVSRFALAIAAAVFLAAPAATQERRTLERREAAGLDSLEHRVKILDLGRAAHDEAGNERNAAALARAVKYGKALLAGDERAAAASEEGVPSLGNLAELLQAASGIYREAGKQDRASACAALSKYYVQMLRGDEAEAEEREGREERGEAEEHEAREQEGEQPAGDIQNLEHRIEIIRIARAAWAEANRREQASYMERFLHVAELQNEGAAPEALAKAYEGLTIGNIIELLHGAHNLYAEWGNEKRARLCHQLAQYYTERERARGGEEAEARDRPTRDRPDREQAERERADRERAEREQADRERAERERADRDQAELRELLQRLEQLEAELKELQQAIRNRLRR